MVDMGLKGGQATFWSEQDLRVKSVEPPRPEDKTGHARPRQRHLGKTGMEKS